MKKIYFLLLCVLSNNLFCCNLNDDPEVLKRESMYEQFNQRAINPLAANPNLPNQRNSNQFTIPDNILYNQPSEFEALCSRHYWFDSNIINKLKTNPDIDKSDIVDQLICAIKYRNKEIIDYILSIPNILDEPSSRGDTILNIAFTTKYLSLFEYLLQIGANSNIPNKDGTTLLESATQNIYHEIKEKKTLPENNRILININEIKPKYRNAVIQCINPINPLDRNPSYIWTQNLNPNIIQEFFFKNKKNYSNYTCPNNIQIMQRLVQTSSNITAKNNDTCIFFANTGDIESLKICLEKGADINTADNQGKTLLEHAVDQENIPMIEFLISQGASVNKGNTTPLMLAINNTTEDIVKILLNAGVNTEGQTKKRLTPLARAVQLGEIEIATMLVDAGANIGDTQDTWGPLYIAHKNDHNNILKMLQEKKIAQEINDLPLNASNNARLMIAASYGHLELVRAGINEIQPTNVKILNDALMIAYQNNQYDAACELIQAGANIEIFNHEEQGILRAMIASQDKQKSHLIYRVLSQSRDKSVKNNWIIDANGIITYIVKPQEKNIIDDLNVRIEETRSRKELITEEEEARKKLIVQVRMSQKETTRKALITGEETARKELITGEEIIRHQQKSLYCEEAQEKYKAIKAPFTSCCTIQ